MLTGKRWPGGRQADAVLTMAGNTGLRGFEAGAAIAASRYRVRTECREIRGYILNFLVGKAGRLRDHGWVLTRTVAIALQSNDQIASFLAAKLGDAIRRIGIAIALYAMTAQTGVSEDFTALHIAFSIGALRKDAADKNQRGESYCDFIFCNHLIVLCFFAARPHWTALRGRYGSDIRLRILDRRRVARSRLHASITRSLAPLRVFAVKKGILALFIVVALAVLITPGVIGHLAEQGVNDSLEWVDSESGAFAISTTEFERSWFRSAGQHRIQLLESDLPVLVVNTRLDHGLVPVSSLSRENGSLLPGLGSAVSTLGLEYSDGSVEPLPITIYTTVGLTGALRSQLIVAPGGVGAGENRIDWGGSEFLITSSPVNQSFSVTGAFSSLAIESDIDTAIVGEIEVDLALAATPYGYMVGAVYIALDSFAVIGAEQTMTVGPISYDSYSSLDGDRVSGDLNLNVENAPLLAGGTVGVQLIARLEDADAAKLGETMRSIEAMPSVADYAEELAQVEDDVLGLLAGGMQLHFDQLDVLSPFGQFTSRASVTAAPSDSDAYTWATAATLLNGSANLSLPKGLVDMATQANPDLHGVIGMGYLRKRGEFYLMEASFADSVLTINGAPTPIPLPGL